MNVGGNATSRRQKGRNYQDKNAVTKTLDQELLNFYYKVISMRRQHSLAHERFRALEAVWHSNLLVILSLSCGFMSFLTAIVGYERTITADTDQQARTGDVSPDYGPVISQQTREMLSILVGGLSFLQVAIMKLGTTWNFGSRSEMHKQVANSLDKLVDTYHFDRNQTQDFAGTACEESAENLQRYQDVFEQCMASCSNSPLPVRVKQAFMLLETELPLFLASDLNLRFNVDSDFYKLLYLHAFNELDNEVSDYFFWPLHIVSPRKAVRRVIGNVRRTYDKYIHDENRGENIESRGDLEHCEAESTVRIDYGTAVYNFDDQLSSSCSSSYELNQSNTGDIKFLKKGNTINNNSVKSKEDAAAAITRLWN